eukprot:8878928-Alexandrium_andersonii.AAC.1
MGNDARNSTSGRLPATPEKASYSSPRSAARGPPRLAGWPRPRGTLPTGASSARARRMRFLGEPGG